MIAEELKTKKTFYICSLCDKDYKNYNSLGNHNRKFHPINKVQEGSNKPQESSKKGSRKSNNHNK